MEMRECAALLLAEGCRLMGIVEWCRMPSQLEYADATSR